MHSDTVLNDWKCREHFENNDIWNFNRKCFIDKV